MIEAGREALQVMDFGDRQAVLFVHRDKNHADLHIITNRVGEDGRAASSSNDAFKLKMWAKGYEERTGGIIVMCRENADRRTIPHEPKRIRQRDGTAVPQTLIERQQWRQLHQAHAADKTPAKRRKQNRTRVGRILTPACANSRPPARTQLPRPTTATCAPGRQRPATRWTTSPPSCCAARRRRRRPPSPSPRRRCPATRSRTSPPSCCAARRRRPEPERRSRPLASCAERADPRETPPPPANPHQPADPASEANVVDVRRSRRGEPPPRHAAADHAGAALRMGRCDRWWQHRRQRAPR